MANNKLIMQAIHSAKCRVYKLNGDKKRGISAQHQIKAENQMELMEITVEALNLQLAMKPLDVSARYGGKAVGGVCPVCRSRVNSKEYNYCRKCGQKMEWSEEDEEN